MITGYLLALRDARRCSMPPGISLGVRLPLREWVQMTALIAVGLIPFAALGVVIGHLVTPDSIGPCWAARPRCSRCSAAPGSRSPAATMQKIAEALPSYWLVQAGHVALGGHGWSSDGLARDRRLDGRGVVLARQAYRRDTERV